MHMIARTYGKLPHEILALEPEELTLAAMALDEAQAHSARLAQQIGFSGGIVFPVFPLGV